MSGDRVQSEADWLVSLDDRGRINFLARLARNLTVAGRSSYEVQGAGLDRPSHLRAINEVQHLDQSISGAVHMGFVDSIASWLLRNQEDKELEQLLGWAWDTTKEHGA
jgi:hypothetical protein